MSPKPEYQIINRTHYPKPNRENIEEQDIITARKEITRLYEEIGISLYLDKLTFIK